jgi:hypothetical protein
MILADTSIWIDHFRRGDLRFVWTCDKRLLAAAQLLSLAAEIRE